MYELDYLKTFSLAFISSIVWNILIIELGIVLGNNISLIDGYLSAYSKVVLIASIILLVYFLIRFILKKKNAKN